MRMAVLISGEYRTFARCRPYMAFLDRPDVDVYFSTWNISRQENKLLNIRDEFLVDYEMVVRDLGFAPASCAIDEPIVACSVSKMINRWKIGIDLIESSGVQYDYFLQVRPDLRVDHIKITDEFIADIGDCEMYVGWPFEISLGDTIHLGKFHPIVNLMKSLDLKLLDGGIWHTQWLNWTLEAGINLNCFGVDVQFDRGHAKSLSFHDIGVYARAWHDLHNASLIINGLDYSMHDQHWLNYIFDVAGRYYLGEYDEFIAAD